MTAELSHEEERKLHERWIAEIEKEWAPLFERCPDPVMVYLDDEHKTCNQRAADFWGMTIPEFKALESYLDECVTEDSIDLVVHNYRNHFQEETRPIQFDYTGRRKDRSHFPATAFNIPMVHDGQLMLMAFIREREQ